MASAAKSALLNCAPSRQPLRLEALPCELLERIAENLSPLSVMSLRLTSRSLALKLPLDDRFWRRQLCSGSLLPYLWDLDEVQMKDRPQRTPKESPKDWRGLVRLFRTEECLKWGQDPSAREIPAGLWNRCRIWSIVEGACVPCDTKTQVPIATLRCQSQGRASKIEYTRMLSLGVIATLIVLVVMGDLHSAGLLPPLSNVHSDAR